VSFHPQPDKYPPHQATAALHGYVDHGAHSVCPLCSWAWLGSEWLAGQLRDEADKLRSAPFGEDRDAMIALLENLAARGERK
jgi:hypothetical protein